MDVDTERLTTDDEHMDYEEDLGSVRDDDGDEIMEDEEYEGEYAMEAEPIVNETADAPVPFPGATLHSPINDSAPLLSPSNPVPGSAGFGTQPLPATTREAPETAMSPANDETALPAKHETGDGPLISSEPSKPFESSTNAEAATSRLSLEPPSHHSPPPPEASMRSIPEMKAVRSLESAKSPRPLEGDHEGGGEIEEEYYEEEAAEYEYPIDAHSLPPVIMNLPDLGARCLFTPLPDDGNHPRLPVWLKGREGDLFEASLADVWAAIRAEMVREGVAKGGEMVVKEQQMDLKMGEDDVNLQVITFLELLQLHHGCELPIPVQLYIAFEPHRFIARFNAISSEVKVQDERRKSTAVEAGTSAGHEDEEKEGAEAEELQGNEENEQVEAEGGEGDYDEEYIDEGEEANGDEREEDGETRKRRDEEEALKRKRERERERNTEARAEYGGSRKAERPGEPSQAHPLADRANARPTSPVQYYSGSRIVLPRRSSRGVEAEEPIPDDPPRPSRREREERKRQDEVSEPDRGSDIEDGDTKVSNTSLRSRTRQRSMDESTQNIRNPDDRDSAAEDSAVERLHEKFLRDGRPPDPEQVSVYTNDNTATGIVDPDNNAERPIVTTSRKDLVEPETSSLRNRRDSLSTIDSGVLEGADRAAFADGGEAVVNKGGNELIDKEIAEAAKIPFDDELGRSASAVAGGIPLDEKSLTDMREENVAEKDGRPYVKPEEGVDVLAAKSVEGEVPDTGLSKDIEKMDVRSGTLPEDADLSAGFVPAEVENGSGSIDGGMVAVGAPKGEGKDSTEYDEGYGSGEDDYLSETDDDLEVASGLEAGNAAPSVATSAIREPSPDEGFYEEEVPAERSPANDLASKPEEAAWPSTEEQNDTGIPADDDSIQVFPNPDDELDPTRPLTENYSTENGFPRQPTLTEFAGSPSPSTPSTLDEFAGTTRDPQDFSIDDEFENGVLKTDEVNVSTRPESTRLSSLTSNELDYTRRRDGRSDATTSKRAPLSDDEGMTSDRPTKSARSD